MTQRVPSPSQEPGLALSPVYVQCHHLILSPPQGAGLVVTFISQRVAQHSADTMWDPGPALLLGHCSYLSLCVLPCRPVQKEEVEVGASGQAASSPLGARCVTWNEPLD